MSCQRLMFILYIYHSVVLFCVSAQFHGTNENNGIRLLPAYAIASRASLLGSTTCGTQLRNFQDAVDQRILWGLKILDSSGGPKPGFLYGNNFWLGSRSQCLDATNRIPFEIAERLILNNTRYHNPQNEFPPFEVNYIVAYLKHNSTLQYHMGLQNEDVITLGLCLPASCSVNDVSFILEGIFRDRGLLINDLYSVDLSLIQVKDLKDDHQWLLSGAIPLICVVLVLIFSMMISGTIYDIFIYQKYLKAKRKTAVSVENTVEEMEMTNSSTPCKKNRIGKVLMCFSIYTNTKMIFNTEMNADVISVIHGLRFLTMFWIIMVHTIFYTADYFDNKMWVMRFSEGIPIQVISNATISVDTFFFISGFLLTYTYLKDKTDEKWNKSCNYGEKLKEFFVCVIRRFIRLTPPYMMMIGILQINSAWYDKTSQFYVQEKPHETCAKYWWRNLLYINNLFDYNTMCMSWSWYLASDMQFFTIGLALLILSSIYFYTAVAILSMLLMGSIILSGYTSYINEYVPTLDEQYRLLDVLYFPPWLRIGPYIIGMITGYIIVRLNKNISLKKNTIILCWTLGSACNIFVLFGLCNRQISILSTAIYVALSRTVWGIGIAWIVIVCFTKHGGIVKELLTSKIWIPLSRLTYCAYLLNPFIINSIRLHNETSVHLEFLSMSAMVIGHFGLSYFCAYALSLIAESPFILLMRIFIQSRSRKKYKGHEIIISHT
ncbi:nose resistant to fluoxetine protein 6 [Solenopsis invicta]|uniref:nose resistant to fluoxetine protein 6 n=1 Tax=Solenopsis invicta TaxID=13686 RepID=UPI00059607A0|nr:nose resistant to fluoxetine protein 6 [Solenopsis invicta]XP_025988215.1 nose resistant to fluoxetine protein 6 [Solenopsis invicta]